MMDIRLTVDPFEISGGGIIREGENVATILRLQQYSSQAAGIRDTPERVQREDMHHTL